MGYFTRLAGTAVERIVKGKEESENEKAFIRNHVGSKAICAYIANLFEKGNTGYNWLKENRKPLNPVVHKDFVALCYVQGYQDRLPKEIEVGRFTFEEMYQWYGLKPGQGYSYLRTRIMFDTLEWMINAEVQKLPHMKFSGGYLVKMFQ